MVRPNSLAVSEADVWRVYEEDVKDNHFVLTSFVPRGGVDLVASGSGLFTSQFVVDPVANPWFGS